MSRCVILICDCDCDRSCLRGHSLVPTIGGEIDLFAELELDLDLDLEL